MRVPQSTAHHQYSHGMCCLILCNLTEENISKVGVSLSIFGGRCALSVKRFAFSVTELAAGPADSPRAAGALCTAAV